MIKQSSKISPHPNVSLHYLVKCKLSKIARTEAWQPKTERARTKENVIMVDKMVLSQQDQTQIHHLILSASWCHRDHFFHGGLSVNCSKRCLLKKLTEANCHPGYSCSKLLLNDAIFIWFSDRMLFTITKFWRGTNKKLSRFL